MSTLLRVPQVMERTSLARPTIYKWMERGEFPRPIKLGSRMVAWRESDIEDWIASRETPRKAA